MAEPKDTHVSDKSNDRIYFTQIPNIVFALARTPYDVMFWAIIKKIAGEAGECYLGIRDLAVFCKMSLGQITSCRTYLLNTKLLEGELRKDPGYPNAVWHLRVPDLWARNLEWARDNITLAKQKAFIDDLSSRNYDQWWIEEKETEKKEGGVHQVNTLNLAKARAPGANHRAPGANHRSPGETNNNHKEDSQEEPVSAIDFFEQIRQKYWPFLDREGLAFVDMCIALGWSDNTLVITSATGAGLGWLKAHQDKFLYWAQKLDPTVENISVISEEEYA